MTTIKNYKQPKHIGQLNIVNNTTEQRYTTYMIQNFDNESNYGIINNAQQENTIDNTKNTQLVQNIIDHMLFADDASLSIIRTK